MPNSPANPTPSDSKRFFEDRAMQALRELGDAEDAMHRALRRGDYAESDRFGRLYGQRWYAIVHLIAAGLQASDEAF